ncbi:MAG: VOC family protein [Defluviitaleaceae bacterium]|nr:VOC family protein [Defluviitaleaceae bacterium]
MKIHHIGYLVDSIESAWPEFELLGFSKISETTEDVTRKIYILFIKNDNYVVELIQPVSEQSPVFKLTRRYKNTPYHICYQVENLQYEIENLLNNDARYAILQPPQSAPALGNGKVAFLVSPKIGLIELYEEQVNAEHICPTCKKL